MFYKHLLFIFTLKHFASVGACGLVGRAMYSRLEGLGFDSHCWPCVEVLGKLRIPHCLGPPSRNGYLVHRSKVGSIVAGCIGAHLARGKAKSVEHALSWSLDSKQLPLPLPLSVRLFTLFNTHKLEGLSKSYTPSDSSCFLHSSNECFLNSISFLSPVTCHETTISVVCCLVSLEQEHPCY